MKQSFTLGIIAALLSIAMQAQNDQTTRLIDDLEIVTLGKKFVKESSNIEGSPYLNTRFSAAKVSNVAKNALMRYNVYYDDFEYIDSKRDTLVLTKSEQFDKIAFVGINTKYQLVDYTSSKGKLVTGYLIWLYENKEYTLFKKQTISYEKEKIATTSFDKNSPPKFVREKDTYYLKTNDKGIIELPTSKKGFLKLFPERKVEMEAYIKQADIDFDKESDLIKIVDFLGLK